MYSKIAALNLVRVGVFMVVMYLTIQVGVAWGVEKKAWWQMSWELLVGGSVGAIAGLAFFILFGAVGWVCGALYGAVGLLWLMVGGALGGFGLGAVANIARNPDKYNFHWPTLIAVAVAGFVLARVLSSVAARMVARSFPSTAPRERVG